MMADCLCQRATFKLIWSRSERVLRVKVAQVAQWLVQRAEQGRSFVYHKSEHSASLTQEPGNRFLRPQNKRTLK